MKKLRILPVGAIALAALLFASCPMEAPPVTGGGIEMDPRLFGVWRFSSPYAYEECFVSEQPLYDNDEEPSLGSLVFGGEGFWGDSYGSNRYVVSFGGDIVYAESFGTNEENKESAGILILRLWENYPVAWRWWSEAPSGWADQGYRYPDRSYYGVYYLNCKEDGSKVFFAQTNDQTTNYGPTETRTLEEAKAKFTKANINNMLALDVGDPQSRHDGAPGFKGLPEYADLQSLLEPR